VASGVNALTELTFRGTSLMRSDLTVIMRIVRGLGEVMDVRGEDTIIPNATGRTPRDRKKDRLTIELKGHVAGSGATELLQRTSFKTLRAELRTLFDPSLAPGALVATLEDGTTLSIDARAINILYGDDGIPSFREVSVELEAVEDWA
jgi:hypothetical protein